MKKILSSLIVLATAAITFTSCEDVPSPYDYPNRNGGSEVVVDNDSVYINATFASEFAPFTAVTPQGAPWTLDSHKYAKGTGYANGTTTPSNAYLVSSAVDLTKSKSAYVQFEYMLRYYTNYGKSKKGVVDRVVITDNYTGDPTTTTWTELIAGDKMTEGSDWNTWYKAAVQLPAEFVGKNNIVVALNYACTDNSATWEVRNFVLHEGTTPSLPDNPNPGGSTGGETGGIGTVSGNAITFTATDCGIENADDIGTLVLKDGTKLTFDIGQGKKAPKFYSDGGALRVYPGNTITVSSSKTIAIIAFTCDSAKGTEYTAEGKVNVNPGSFALDGLTMKFTNINATSTVITNAETVSGGKAQMRIKSVVITYAN